MKLAKVVNAEGVIQGLYIVANGECVRVNVWDVYRPISSFVDKETGKRIERKDDPNNPAFLKDDAKIVAKQKNNWRKLNKMMVYTCEGYTDLFDLIKESKDDLIKESK